MQYVRWLLAFPEPGYDTAGKSEALLIWEHTMRKKRSPLWWPIYWFNNVKTRVFVRLIGFRNFLWTGTPLLSSMSSLSERRSGTLGRWLYVKTDYYGTEANTISFVTSHTNIPLPHLWLTASWRGTKYMFMSRIHGVELVKVWNCLTDDKKQYIADQLRNYILQLRAIPPPGGTSICSVNGSPVQSHRLIQWEPTCGPFHDEDHLNHHLWHLKPLESLLEIVQRAHAKHHPLVFTHNDFFPRNIMIDSELIGNVLAIIDWESAGWFPSHWEYCVSSNWGKLRREQQEWMEKYIPKIVPVFEDEAEADRMLMYDCGLPSVPVIQAP